MKHDSRLTKSNKDYQASLSEMEVKSKLSNSEITPLVHENQRLQTEIDSVNEHVTWLTTELAKYTEDLSALRKSSGSQTVALQNEVLQLTQEKEAEAARVLSLGRSEEGLQNKVESLSKQLMQQKQEQLDAKLAAEQEMTAEQRLVSLQQEQITRLEKAHNDVVDEMEAMKVKANQALDEARKERQQRVERESNQMKHALEEQATQYETQLDDLTQQVRDANRRRLEVEDRFLSLPSTTNTATPLAITAAGEAQDGPLSLTDLSARLAQAQSDLIAERSGRKRAEIRFERVQAQIEATTPQIILQKQEYENALKRQDDFQQRLEDQINEVRVQRAQMREMGSELANARKEKQNLKAEAEALAKQVQTILLTRSGQVIEHGDIPTSIEEIQSQNQRLLGEHRRLTSMIKELEDKLKSDTLRLKLDDAEKELSRLREDREQQESLVVGIVQQRDLYRALLSQHDSKLLGTADEEVTAIEMTKRQSERSKALELKNEDLETELAGAKGELDRALRDQETVSERLARNEALVANLTTSVDTLQMEVSTAKSDAARTKAEASYCTERASRMEESLQKAKGEIEHITNAKNQLQRINNDLQNAVTNANSESSRLEGELRQVRTHAD